MQANDKTTLSELLKADSNQVNPLIANSTDEIIELASTTLTPPAIGQYWPGQGGVYAGIIRDGEHSWHLLLAAQQIETTTGNEPQFTINPITAITAAWGDYGTEPEGNFSDRDGFYNTHLILTSDSRNEIASGITALEVAGHVDFYWPAKFELNLLCINLPEYFDKKFHWSSTQYSADYAWFQDFEDGRQGIYYKDFRYAARAVRRILII